MRAENLSTPHVEVFFRSCDFRDVRIFISPYLEKTISLISYL
jgi:hypothetical protein